MAVRPAVKRSVDEALALDYGAFVDAGEPPFHEAVIVELPDLIVVGSEPLPGAIVILVGKPHSDAIVRERPYLFDLTVVDFAPPFAC